TRRPVRRPPDHIDVGYSWSRHCRPPCGKPPASACQRQPFLVRLGSLQTRDTHLGAVTDPQQRFRCKRGRHPNGELAYGTPEIITPYLEEIEGHAAQMKLF